MAKKPVCYFFHFNRETDRLTIRWDMRNGATVEEWHGDMMTRVRHIDSGVCVGIIIEQVSKVIPIANNAEPERKTFGGD